MGCPPTCGAEESSSHSRGCLRLQEGQGSWSCEDPLVGTQMSPSSPSCTELDQILLVFSTRQLGNSLHPSCSLGLLGMLQGTVTMSIDLVASELLSNLS